MMVVTKKNLRVEMSLNRVGPQMMQFLDITTYEKI